MNEKNQQIQTVYLKLTLSATLRTILAYKGFCQEDSVKTYNVVVSKVLIHGWNNQIKKSF